MSSVTISIPVYNDQTSLTNLMEDLMLNGIKGANIFYFIIDDGSKDGSKQTILELKSKYENVNYLLHKENYGFGKTITEAITIPKTDFVLFVPGDHQFKSDSILQLLKVVIEDENIDYILGFRENRADNIYRKILSRIYNFMISLVAQKKVEDVNSIFVIKRKILDNIQLKSSSAFIHAEIYLRLIESNALIKYINIRHYKRNFGNGSGGKLKIIVPTCIDFFKFVMNKKNE